MNNHSSHKRKFQFMLGEGLPHREASHRPSTLDVSSHHNQKLHPSGSVRVWLIIAGLLLSSLACFITNPQGTAIPAGRPSSFDIQTVTPTLDPDQVATTSALTEVEPTSILPLGDAPTHTPDPNAPPTLPPLPTDTPTLVVVTPTGELTGTVAITPTAAVTQTAELTQEVAAPPPPRPTVEPAPPLAGGEWDFEADFIPWGNPYGEPCPGGRVASGWTAFVEDGPYGSSCMNENLYQPNVLSGVKSQEITFDFIAANSGILRTIPTSPGHRYSVTAHAKHDHSLSPVEMALGFDLTGGTAWNAETVQWFPWDDGAEDTWVATEETIAATGETMTIFIKGVHPLAEQGGKTVIDNVSVTDLGGG